MNTIRMALLILMISVFSPATAEETLVFGEVNDDFLKRLALNQDGKGGWNKIISEITSSELRPLIKFETVVKVDAFARRIKKAACQENPNYSFCGWTFEKFYKGFTTVNHLADSSTAGYLHIEASEGYLKLPRVETPVAVASTAMPPPQTIIKEITDPSLRSDLNKLDEAIKKVGGDSKDLTNKLNSLQKRFNELEKSSFADKVELDRLAKGLEALKKQPPKGLAADDLKKIADLEKGFGNLVTKKELAEALDALEGKLTASGEGNYRDLEVRIVDLERKIKDLPISATPDQVQALAAQVKKLNDDVADFINQQGGINDAFSKQIKDLEAGLSELKKSAITGDDFDYSAANSSIADLKNDVAALKKAPRSFEKAAEIQRRITELTKLVNGFKKAQAGLVGKVKDLATNVNNRFGQVDANADALEGRLSAAEAGVNGAVDNANNALDLAKKATDGLGKLQDYFWIALAILAALLVGTWLWTKYALAEKASQEKMRHVQGAISNISESLATVVTNQDTVNTEISKINSGLEKLESNLALNAVYILNFGEFKENFEPLKKGTINSFDIRAKDLVQGVPKEFIVTIKPCEDEEGMCRMSGISGQTNKVRIENVAHVVSRSHGRLTNPVVQ